MEIQCYTELHSTIQLQVLQEKIILMVIPNKTARDMRFANANTNLRCCCVLTVTAFMYLYKNECILLLTQHLKYFGSSGIPAPQ
jgi:hypothetical protein